MAKRGRGRLLGRIECNVCGFRDGEVREDKNANPYIYCPDCSAQSMTHGDHRAELLRKRMRPEKQTPEKKQTPEQKFSAAVGAEPAPAELHPEDDCTPGEGWL